MPVSFVIKAFCNVMKFFIDDKSLTNDMMSQLEAGMARDYEDKPRLLFLKGKETCIKLKDIPIAA